MKKIDRRRRQTGGEALALAACGPCAAPLTCQPQELWGVQEGAAAHLRGVRQTPDLLPALLPDLLHLLDVSQARPLLFAAIMMRAAPKRTSPCPCCPTQHALTRAYPSAFLFCPWHIGTRRHSICRAGWMSRDVRCSHVCSACCLVGFGVVDQERSELVRKRDRTVRELVYSRLGDRLGDLITISYNSSGGLLFVLHACHRAVGAPPGTSCAIRAKLP